jgi:cold-inducible RNA-binding protein
MNSSGGAAHYAQTQRTRAWTVMRGPNWMSWTSLKNTCDSRKTRFSDDLESGVCEPSKKAQLNRTIKLHMNNQLFVGNLSFITTENDLHDAFSVHGTVTDANLMVDRNTNRPRGFAFITMSTDEEAQQAIAAMNGKELDGRALTVSVARRREERPGGRRPYGGGRDRY